MIAGRVPGGREALVRIQARALERTPATIEAVIDTGFTECIALARDQIAQLGLNMAGLQTMALADGSVKSSPIYDAAIYWHGRWVNVHAIEIGGGALLGMGLLRGSRLTMDVVENGPVQIEPIGTC